MYLNFNGNTMISPAGVGFNIDQPGFNMSMNVAMNTDPFSSFPIGGFSYSSMVSGLGVYPTIGEYGNMGGYGRRSPFRDVFAWMNDPDLLRIGDPKLFDDVWRKNDVQWARMQGKREERLAQRAREKQQSENDPANKKMTKKEWEKIARAEAMAAAQGKAKA